jgi:hypothetical protein
MNDLTPVTLNINGVHITTKKSINILGVIFDSKLNWTEQVTSFVYKSKKSLNAIRIIRKCFNTKELVQIVTSTYF